MEWYYILGIISYGIFILQFGLSFLGGDSEMAPALAVERMIAAGLVPEMVVNYKMVDQLAGIAEAQAKIYEHIQLGNVTVYGDKSTAGEFMANMAQNLSPAMSILGNLPIADTVKKVLGKDTPKVGE